MERGFIRFEYRVDGDPKLHVVVECSPHASLEEVIETFRNFLLAATYPMEGRKLEIVEKDEDEETLD